MENNGITRQEKNGFGEGEKPPSLFSRLNVEIGGGISVTDKMAFARNLATMLKAGLPPSRALSVITRQSKKRSVVAVVRALGEGITRGETLSAGLSRFPRVFSPLFVAVVKAGEESGTLFESLTTVGEHLGKSYELEKRVRAALIYPAIILIAMAVVAAIMLFYVVPVLSTTFEELGVALPLSTRIVIGASAFLNDSLSLSLAIFAGALLAFAAAAGTKKGRHFFDLLVLHTPILSLLVEEVNVARTARTLSSLLSAGIPMTEALAVTEEVLQNSYYRAAVAEARDGVGKGAALSATFARYEKIYPPVF